jgi:periplasmic divalent cation tolerance protein
MADDDICEVIITAPDETWLLHFTQQLITERLAACGHHTAIRSLYTWDGAIHDAHETRVALHTAARHVQAIIDATNRSHPYEVPCVIAVPINHADPAYRAWVLASTQAPPL